MRNVHVIDHPLVQHNLTTLRDRKTGPETFRQALGVVASLMVYEATRSLPTRAVAVHTPLARVQGCRLARPVILVPILRAGLGMLFSIMQLVPNAQVGFIGLKRDETSLRASTYHNSLPAKLQYHEVLLIDPMLATGGSLLAALDLLTERGARQITLVNLVASPAGIGRVRGRYPRLPIYTAAIDPELNDRGYIVPGLGDAGDRLFGV